MQNPTSTVFQQINASSSSSQQLAGGGLGLGLVQFPEQEQLRCPRCDSANTKFCYYNNYNLSQPRHFCKACRRYWTKGGALRNIPVGGGSRKNSASSVGSAKRSSTNSASKNSSPPSSKRANPEKPRSSPLPAQERERDPQRSPIVESSGPVHDPTLMFGLNGSSLTFSSVLPSTEQVGSFFMETRRNDDTPMSGKGRSEGVIEDLNVVVCSGSDHGRNSSRDDGDREEGFLQNGEWPDLAIYTPGPDFQ